MTDPQLPGALMFHFGPLPGVTYFDGAIENWPPEAGVPVPTDGEQATYLAAYLAGPVADQAAEIAREADLGVTINADAVIAQLKKMTTADFNVWWAANVTNLAQANVVLKKLALLMLHRL